MRHIKLKLAHDEGDWPRLDVFGTINQQTANDWDVPISVPYVGVAVEQQYPNGYRLLTLNHDYEDRGYDGWVFRQAIPLNKYQALALAEALVRAANSIPAESEEYDIEEETREPQPPKRVEIDPDLENFPPEEDLPW